MIVTNDNHEQITEFVVSRLKKHYPSNIFDFKFEETKKIYTGDKQQWALYVFGERKQETWVYTHEPLEHNDIDRFAETLLRHLVII